jgi:hypothetical protein
VSARRHWVAEPRRMRFGASVVPVGHVVIVRDPTGRPLMNAVCVPWSTSTVTVTWKILVVAPSGAVAVTSTVRGESTVKSSIGC